MKGSGQIPNQSDKNNFLPLFLEFIRGSFEISLVAVFGLLLVQLALLTSNLSSYHILSDSRIVFTVLVAEASVTLLIIFLLLCLHNENWEALGCKWENAKRESLIGLASVPFLFASTFVVSALFQLLLPSHVTAVNPLLNLVEERGDLALFIISSVYVGGVKEELQRAFVLDRFERYVGRFLIKLTYGVLRPGQELIKGDGRRTGLIVGLVLWSTFFAWGHAIQGVDNAVAAGVLGLLFGLLYIWRRNLLSPMLAHASYNITTLIAFWMSSGS